MDAVLNRLSTIKKGTRGFATSAITNAQVPADSSPTSPLANSWDLAAQFKKAYPYIMYCTETQLFFMYFAEFTIWKPINVDKITSLFIA